jgi:hypothetical protein
MNSRTFGLNKAWWIVAAMIALAAPGFAATTGTLTLSGTVSGMLEIAVTPAAAASALDLTVDVTDLAVATVNERSNRKAGYTVVVSSANALAAAANQAFLQSADPLNPDTLDYTLTYDGAAVALVAGSAQVSDVWAKTPASGTDKELCISYSGSSSFLNADAYADTLTFTITAK